MTVPDQAIPELEEFAYKVAGRQPAILGLPGYQVDFVPGGPLLVVTFEPTVSKGGAADFSRPADHSP